MSKDNFETLENEAFERAVAKATAQISQNLAKIHRRRLVTQTAVVVALIVSIISVAVTAVIRSEEASTSRDNALVNCGLVSKLTNTMSDFVTTEAHLREVENATDPQSQKILNKGFLKILPKSFLFKAEKKSQATAKATVSHWVKVDVPQLKSLAKTNCGAEIK